MPKYVPKINPMEGIGGILGGKKNKVFNSKEECINSINEHLSEMSKLEVMTLCQI
jgi:hypothetical protein